MTTPVPRVGGRLLLIDPAARVLLIHERLEDDTTHWLTPGGGVEPGESPREAAVREATEETGIAVDLAPDAGVVLTTRRTWSWAGATYDQVDYFFLAQVESSLDVVPQQLTELERQTYLGHRWWTAAELRETSEVIEPPEIADAVERHGGKAAADG